MTARSGRALDVVAFARLRNHGRMHVPGEAGYEAARVPWNVACDQRPAAVAEPASAAEAAALVRAAAASGLRIAAQSTGHGPGGLGGLGGVVLVRTRQMAEVSVQPDAHQARVGAGVLWQDVVRAAAGEGLAALHGSSPNVGVAGYSLGGGLGWYARQLGLQANSVTAVELISAGGEAVRADATTEPDLFWALRGGGGNFGLVTALEFALHEVGTPYAGMLVWDWRQSGRVLRRWADWAAGAPVSATTTFRLLQLPPLPEIPQAVRGRRLAVIDGAVLGGEDEAVRILAPLRELAPELDTFGPVDPAALTGLHMEPEEPTPAVSEAVMVSGLPESAIDALLAAVGPGSGSSLMVAELRQLGGALGRPEPGAGALPVLAGGFLLLTVALAMTPETAALGSASARRAAQALAPWQCGVYLNFTDRTVDARTAYSDSAWRRLRAIRTAADPDELFLASHRVPPA